MQRGKTLLILLLLSTGSRLAAQPAFLTWPIEHSALLPEASFAADFRYFTLRKDSMFQEKYVSESNMHVDVALLSVNRTFFFMFRAEQKAGQGRSPSGMVLHPRDISYGLIPTFEYRFPRLILAAGLDHRCFHEIDQKELPTVYWNKMIIGVASPHGRVRPQVAAFIPDSAWQGGWFNRLDYSLVWGNYLRSFFGLVASGKLMSPERPLYCNDFTLQLRYGAARWRSGVLLATSTTLVGFGKGWRNFWGQQTGVELVIDRRRFDASVFVNYIVDEGKFDSKDKLLAWGLRIYK